MLWSSGLRAYVLHYPKTGDGTGDRVEIACGGPRGKRRCRTHGSDAYGGVYVTYDLSQDGLTIPGDEQSTSLNATTEPEALLAFDSHLRSWIASLRTKP
jgi:hypothetical protein